MTVVNLNQYATIHLTSEGEIYVRKVLKAKKYPYQKIRTLISIKDWPYINLRMQLWEIMSYFPNLFYNGSNLIENSEMILEDL